MACAAILPIGSGRAAKMPGEDTREVVDVRVTDGGSDLLDGLVSMEQQAAGAIQAGAGDVGGDRGSGEAGEEARQMARRDVDVRGDLRQRERMVEVVVNIAD